MNKTKKIITALVLLLLLAIPVLFSVTVLLKQKIVQYQREERLGKERLQTITVSSKNIFWIKPGKEVLFDGKLFDVKSFKTEGGIISLTGFFDNKEDILVQQILKLTKHRKQSGGPFNEHAIKFLFFPVYISQQLINCEEGYWKFIPKQYYSFAEMIPIAPCRSLLHPPC